MARRRVSLGTSFRIADNAGSDSTNPDMIAPQSTLLAPVIFGVWWWIVGVPEAEFNRNGPLAAGTSEPSPISVGTPMNDNGSGMVVRCTECGCAVESGIRVSPCDRVDCCCLALRTSDSHKNSN